MPSYEYELTTPLSVDKSDAVELLQDPRRFLISGGGTLEDSIRFDEAENRWHGTSKSGVPFLPKPEWSGTFEKTADGSHWIIDAGMGITTEHTWSVEGATGGEAAKWKMPSMAKETHKNMQEYLS